MGFFVWNQIEGFSKDWESIGIFNLWNTVVYDIYQSFIFSKVFTLSLPFVCCSAFENFKDS